MESSDKIAGEIDNINPISEKNIVRRKYLIFKLGNERFGVALSSVKEVIGVTEITEVPQVPLYFKGLINLRGRIISVIDLRLKLNFPAAEYLPKKTSIIITEVGETTLGVIVDDVEEVASYEQSQIESSVEVQSKISKEYMRGVARTANNKLVLLIDFVSVITGNDLDVLKNKAC